MDRSTLGVFFAAAPGTKPATDLVLDARPVAGSRALKGSSKLAGDTRDVGNPT